MDEPDRTPCERDAEEIKAAIAVQIQEVLPYLERGEPPPGYEVFTREQLDRGELFA